MVYQENSKANYFIERRKLGRLKFYDASKTWIGPHIIENRIGPIINGVDFNWIDGISNDAIRQNLKKYFIQHECSAQMNFDY